MPLLSRGHTAVHGVLMHRKCILHICARHPWLPGAVCVAAAFISHTILLFSVSPNYQCIRHQESALLIHNVSHVGGALNANQICLPRLFVSYLLSSDPYHSHPIISLWIVQRVGKNLYVVSCDHFPLFWRFAGHGTALHWPQLYHRLNKDGVILLYPYFK